jgi:penicillin-binding protein 2
MELQRMADRKHRPPPPSAEQIVLTRRTFVFKGLAATSFAALTGRLWQLQVRDHEEYKEKGASLIERPFPLPAARGLIYDRAGQLLADNKKSWAVAVVPAHLPPEKTQPAERAALFATLTNHLKMGDLVTIATKEFPAEPAAREEIYGRLAAILGLPVEEVRDRAEPKLGLPPAQRPATVKVSRDAVPPERLAAVRVAAPDLPGVAIVNPIRYLIETEGEEYVPLVIKRGISKEMALGIEANRLYLPGVQVDDQALSRRYYVGEEMGHILGYTGLISAEELEEAIARDAAGNPLLDARGKPRPLYGEKDYIGKMGIEAALEETLRGKPGRYLAQMKDGRVVGEYAQLRQNPTEGHSVALTIDLAFQREAINILNKGIALAYAENEKHNADMRRAGKKERLPPAGTGAIVALNPRNGEILAMVSLPSYDPRHFVEGISEAQFDLYNETNLPDEQKRFPLLNRCIAGAFPPGSTVKTFMAAAGLQEGAIAPDTKYTCPGHIQVPLTWNEENRQPYWCYTRDASHGDQDVTHALATSCDVFFYTLSAPQQTDERGVDLHFYLPNDPAPHPFTGLGIERINRYLQYFGFGERTGIEVAGERRGLAPSPEAKEEGDPGNYWSVGDTINTSIGQGYFLATPLQLCNATAAVANGGTLYRPTLVRRVLDSQGQVVREAAGEVLRALPIDPVHIATVREGLRMSLADPDGLVSRTPRDNSGDKFPLPPGIDGGVKTGTAEYGNEFDEDGRSLRAHAWCAAFAPFDDPEICVVAFIEGGFGSAAVAAPVASEMINAYYARYHPELWGPPAG